MKRLFESKLIKGKEKPTSRTRGEGSPSPPRLIRERSLSIRNHSRQRSTDEYKEFRDSRSPHKYPKTRDRRRERSPGEYKEFRDPRSPYEDQEEICHPRERTPVEYDDFRRSLDRSPDEYPRRREIPRVCTPYVYQKLDFDIAEIRILKFSVYSAESENSLSAEVNRISLIEPPEYFALSYVSVTVFSSTLYPRTDIFASKSLSFEPFPLVSLSIRSNCSCLFQTYYSK